MNATHLEMNKLRELFSRGRGRPRPPGEREDAGRCWRKLLGVDCRQVTDVRSKKYGIRIAYRRLHS